MADSIDENAALNGALDGSTERSLAQSTFEVEAPPAGLGLVSFRINEETSDELLELEVGGTEREGRHVSFNDVTDDSPDEFRDDGTIGTNGGSKARGESRGTSMTGSRRIRQTGGRRTTRYTTAAGGGRRAVRGTGGGGVTFHQYNMPQGMFCAFNDDDDDKNGDDSDSKDIPEFYQEAITLPQSTHTLLYTENVLSIPFAFAFSIFALSMVCLGLALYDNLDGATADNPLNLPTNVGKSVHAAQYFSIVIAVLMEEEIPTGLYLLRVISKGALKNKLGLSYTKFVASAICRLAIGYLFLSNVFLVVVQSERVLDMFYDMLALNFVSMIDDIAFKLAQLDILGKRLRTATSSACFLTEFERKPYIFRKKVTNFVKFVFGFNFLLLVALVSAVFALQMKGTFQCETITVTFGEDIWENAWVETSNETMILVYSFFNGVYKKNGTSAGRPIYRELRKSEEEHFGAIEGAVIKFCEEENMWVFMHEKIRKHESDESSCPWLLRSPGSTEYDLMDVSAPWDVWVGVLETDAQMSIKCNNCEDDTDCNLNGICRDQARPFSRTRFTGRCDCTNPEYLYGSYCEIETPCPKVIAEIPNDTWEVNGTWSVRYTENCEYDLAYGRPVYDFIGNMTDRAQKGFDVKNRLSLIYTGSRWMGNKKMNGAPNPTKDEIGVFRSDFHAFWNQKDRGSTVAISDPTKGSTPAGVDFYVIGDEEGDQYGPWGVLYPVQDPPGRSVFRCDTMTKVAETAICKNVTSKESPFNKLN